MMDLTGERYGRFIVLSEAARRGKARYWNCLCDCGTEKVVWMNNLRRGTTMSCGCWRKEYDETVRTNDLTGAVFGKLKVLRKSDKRSKNRFLFWVCECECGTIKEILSSSLIHKRTRSCGYIIADMQEEIREIREERYGVDGVLVTNLKRKVYANNQTGVKGVTISKRKDREVYRALITVNKEKIHLGYFETLKEAKKARKEAEERYFQPYLDKFEEEKLR